MTYESLNECHVSRLIANYGTKVYKSKSRIKQIALTNKETALLIITLSVASIQVLTGRAVKVMAEPTNI